MAFALEVPETVRAAIRLPAGELRAELHKELALALYQRDALSLGKARELAQMSKWEFGELLGLRGIARHYTEDDLDADLAFARRS